MENPIQQMINLCEKMLTSLRRLELQLNSDNYDDVRALHMFLSALKQDAESNLGGLPPTNS